MQFSVIKHFRISDKLRANIPTQLSTHGQWWSNLATQRLHM